MIIISGRLYVDAGARDDYLSGCRAVIEQARVTSGCIDFVLSADAIEPDRINVYEQWESEAELEQFRSGGPEPDQAAQIRDAQVRRHQVSSSGPA